MKSPRRPTFAKNRRRPSLERLEDRRVLAATSVQVLAAGLTGTEDVALEIDGVEVRRWDNVGGDFAGRQFQTLSYTHPTDLTADDVTVRFLPTGSTGGDLRVDGVRIDGVKYESESPLSWSTGGWNSSVGAITPRYGDGGLGGEFLFASNGAISYSASAGSTIEVFAAGETNEERMQLLIGEEVVATWDNVQGRYDLREYDTYTYQHSEKVAPADVRVAFVNDGLTSGGADKNIRVDAVAIDGRRYESESAATFGTGTWRSGAIEPGFGRGELIHGNGYFGYSAVGEDGTSAVGAEMIVWAAGATGEESIELVVDGASVARFDNVGGDYDFREFEVYGHAHPVAVALADVEVGFVNDLLTPAGDRNVRIDAIALDGVVHQAEAATTFSTGTWLPDFGVQPGFVQSELLHTNGTFRFDDDPTTTGTLSLGATQYSVGEAGGFVDVEFVRTGGSRGAVSIDYTTVDSTAIAEADYLARTGTLIFADGQTSRTVSVPILDDSAFEGAEAFNVAADKVLGGAFLGQPRTTTVTIFDDESPSAGDGIGLRAEYFAGIGLSDLVTTRTDEEIDFNWGSGSPAAGVPSNGFSARWTGEVQPLYSETYTFETETDDGVRLWVDDVLIIDEWTDQAPTLHAGQITLAAGARYDVRMEYYENSGGAVARLRWESASQAKEIVPTAQLYSTRVIADDGQFVAETVLTGLQQPTALDFAKVGSQDYLFISQKDGRVRLAIDGVLQSQVFLDYRTPVNNVRDRGMLGVAVHPDFENNPYVYVLYTYDPPETQGQSGLAAPDRAGNRGSRLTRVTADASNGYRTAVPGSDVVLLGTNSTWDNISSPDKDSTDDLSLPPSGLDENGEWVPDILITDSQSHTIGAVEFGIDGTLYVSNGDGTSYGRVDPRTTRVQDLDSLSGKVLRIDPLTGEGLSDNPFYTGDPTDDRSKVYNYGLRNPFTMAVDPVSGDPFVGDVGWNSWEELNGGAGKNFGWPYYEGGTASGGQGSDTVNRETGGYRNLGVAQDFYSSGGDSLAEPPSWARSHGAGGVAIVMGDFYTGDLYPTQYQGAGFFTDYGDPTIRAFTLDSDGEIDQSLVVTGSIGTVVEMTMGPDGYLYYADLSGKIGRLAYVNPSSATSAAASLAVLSSEGAAPAAPSVAEPTADDYDTAFALLLIDDPAQGGYDPAVSALGFGSAASSEEDEAGDADEAWPAPGV